MNYNYQHIVVLGAAESGLGAAFLAVRKGFSVFVSDAKSINQESKEFLEKNKIPYEENGHTQELLMQATLVVKSPGIPSDAPLVGAIKSQGVPVISEIEFARPFSKGKTICVTGSNGKTTTSLWIYHILKKAGYDVGLAGNMGVSYAKQVAQNDFEWYVLELSSFQLDDMFHFKADIAVMTNISPDHLDRYNYQMALYIAAKFRILQNMDEDTYFIYNADDIEIASMLNTLETKAVLVPFSTTKPVDF
ncbi:MAG: UDP-N-acetylmuramoyl-L-alanine--D-glutamate ligase, partial [Flavobacteriia bacterium]|nr:UDP-N-acetylmuramoyl-L-alanine--D-glutamate ligase [Flavobacteriia bacterium]